MNQKLLYEALYKCVETDPLRIMSGIYHNDGFLVACDSRILAKVAFEDYNFDFEGQSINSLGKELSGIYPKFESVLPDLRYMLEITDSPIYENLVLACKNLPKGSEDKRVSIHFSGMTLHNLKIAKLINVFTVLGETPAVYVPSTPSAAVAFKSKSCIAIIMPLLDDKKALIDIRTYTIEQALATVKTKSTPVKRNFSKPTTPKMKKQAEDASNEKLNLLSALSQINAVIRTLNPNVEIKEEKEDRTSEAKRSMTISDSHKGKFYVKQSRYVIPEANKEKTIQALRSANVSIADSGKVTIPTGKGSITFMFIVAIDVENKVRLNYPSSAKIEPFSPSKELGNPKSTFFLNAGCMKDKDKEVLARRELNLENIEQAKQNGMFGLAKVFQEEMDRLSV